VSIYLSICLLILLSIYPSVYLFVFLSVCLAPIPLQGPGVSGYFNTSHISLCLLVCLPFCLSLCVSVSLPTYLCVYLSVCLSVCLSAVLFVCLSLCLAAWPQSPSEAGSEPRARRVGEKRCVTRSCAVFKSLCVILSYDALLAINFFSLLCSSPVSPRLLISILFS
jgi:hypothetical protein